VKVLPAGHLACAHCVLLTKLRQAPLPSQVPSSPQVDAADAGQSDAVNGACPAGMLVQMPGLPVSEHDWHLLLQATLQQTPCAQKPDWHSVPMPHIAPGGFLPQLPFTQVLGETQSLA
jgi:hypothetical protein